MRRLIYTTLRPAIYHGYEKQPPYFEGWYYKLVSADQRHRYAVIPGVILGQDGHAFVQVLDGCTGESSYFPYPLDEFWASREHFELRIGSNRFTSDQVDLLIESPDGDVKGSLNFQDLVPWPVSWFSPGIMGWYAWVPFMETYHGVLSFDHKIEGALQVDGHLIDFNEGRGYIEKDWGQSFPEAYIWFQSNHFATPAASITASVAIIPWLKSAFLGFIIGLWVDQQLYRFSTYTGARIERLRFTPDQVDWAVGDKRYLLELKAFRAQGGLLRGPSKLDMGRRVVESLQAQVQVRLQTRSGELIFTDQGDCAGLEVHGDLDRLLSFLS
jgi:tocopherol cyclase